MDNHLLGKSGESLARQFLEKNGYQILAQNFQFYRVGVQGRLGEIDLIAFKDNILHLCEVKTRRSNQFGSPFEQITKKQVQNIKYAYYYFISKNLHLRKLNVQFNAFSVKGQKVEVIYNAVMF